MKFCRNMNRRFRWAVVLVGVIVALIPVIFTIIKMGTLSSDIEMEIYANNSYKRTLTVVGNENFAPYTFIKDDICQGYEVELMNAVGNKIGYNIEFELLPEQELNDKLYVGRPVLIAGAGNTFEELDANRVYTEPIAIDEYALWGYGSLNSIYEIGDSVVGVTKDVMLAAPLFKPAHVVGYNSVGKMFEALENGEIDYAAARMSVGQSYARKHPGMINCLDKECYALSFIRYETTIGNKLVVDEVNRAIRELNEDGTLTKLQEKWLHDYYQHYTLSEVIMTNTTIYMAFLVSILLYVLTIVALALFQKNSEEQLLAQELENRHALEAALNQAQNANKAKTLFLNNMSHDMRTPMNAIIGFTSLALAHLDDSERIKDSLTKIRLSSDYLLSIINDVLDMSSIETGSVKLHESDIHLVEVVEDIKAIASSDAKAKHINFSLNTINISDECVVCDKLRLKKILLNIISNAMNFTNAGGDVSVCISQNECSCDGYAAYEFRISDTGIGMSPEFAKHLYEPFERESTSTKSGVKGTGLGMAITRALVDLMNGTISVSSAKGMGTEVILSFQFKKTDSASAKSEMSEENIEYDFAGKKLLLVEDNELNMEIAQEILESMGFDISTATDGQEAVYMMESSNPGDYDLILMDIQMPKMDGYEATRCIRSLNKSDVSDIPIVAMTANAMDEDKRLAFEAGMNAHIAKPINIALLANTLAEFLE